MSVAVSALDQWDAQAVVLVMFVLGVVQPSRSGVHKYRGVATRNAKLSQIPTSAPTKLNVTVAARHFADTDVLELAPSLPVIVR